MRARITCSLARSAWVSRSISVALCITATPAADEPRRTRLASWAKARAKSSMRGAGRQAPARHKPPLAGQLRCMADVVAEVVLGVRHNGDTPLLFVGAATLPGLWEQRGELRQIVLADA